MRLTTQRQVWYWSAALIALLIALWTVGNAVMPFILGAAVAYLLDPVADRLEGAGLSRTLAVVFITIIAILVMVVAFLVLVPVLMRQTTALIDTAPQMATKLEVFLRTQFPQLFTEGSAVNNALTNVAKNISARGGQLLSTVLGSVMSVFSVLALIVIVPVVAFYLLLDWDNMVARLDDLLPREHAPTVRAIATDIDDALSGFVRGQGLVILILGTFYSIGLGLVGLPFGVAIGVMAASLSFIPYVGVVIGGATAIGVALFSFWGDPLHILAVVAIFGIGQVVEGNYLQPKIVGSSIGLHPVWLMLALTVFGSIFGFVGLLVAVPVSAAIGVLVRHAVGRYKGSSLYTGREIPAPPAPPTRVELVKRGTAERERRQATMSHEVALAQLHQQAHLAQLLRERQSLQRHGDLADSEGPPAPSELWAEERGRRETHGDKDA